MANEFSNFNSERWPRIGDRVVILAPHPKSGMTGTVTKYGTFFGYPAMFVALDDNGFPVGITGLELVRVLD